MVFALPFTLIDAVNYYTVGSAIAFSLPLLLATYTACGALAARLALHHGMTEAAVSRCDFISGTRLRIISTIINTLVNLIAGVLSLGLMMFLGIPYLLFCGPVLLVAGGLGNILGAVVYLSKHRVI